MAEKTVENPVYQEEKNNPEEDTCTMAEKTVENPVYQEEKNNPEEDTCTMAEKTVEEPVYQNYDHCPDMDKIQVMGPDSEHVCLISKDGDRFAVVRSDAMKSSQLSGMMTGPGSAEEGEVNEINLTDISTHTLKIVCEYLWYKSFYTWPKWEEPIPDFAIDKDDAIDVLLAANFLDI